MAIPFSSSKDQRFSWEEVCTAAALEDALKAMVNLKQERFGHWR
jgi:hypothetical protein